MGQGCDCSWRALRNITKGKEKVSYNITWKENLGAYDIEMIHYDPGATHSPILSYLAPAGAAVAKYPAADRQLPETVPKKVKSTPSLENRQWGSLHLHLLFCRNPASREARKGCRAGQDGGGIKLSQ